MIVLIVLWIVLFFFLVTLILSVIFKEQIQAKACKYGYHRHEQGKYYCSSCKKGRGYLTIIDGKKKETTRLKW